MGVEKLGICIGRRLTDTGRFGTLGICRFTFGRLGRLLVKLLWKRKKETEKTECNDVDAQKKAWMIKKHGITYSMFIAQDEEFI